MRPRSARLWLAGACACASVLAIGASSAEATPLLATFNQAQVNAQSTTVGVLQPPTQVALQGADVSAGVVTIPSPTGIGLPPATLNFLGIEVTYAFAPTGALPITGTLSGGGDVSLQLHSYRATITFGGGPTCTYDANLAFSTANPSGGPLAGDPFTVGPPDTTLTAGTLETHWGGLPPDPQPGCAAANSLTSGPGGLSLSNLPASGDPTGRRAAALRKCKKVKNPVKRRKCKRRARRLPV